MADEPQGHDDWLPDVAPKPVPAPKARKPKAAAPTPPPEASTPLKGEAPVTGEVLPPKGGKPKAPVAYSRELADEILSGIVEGKSLAETLRQDGMPSVAGFFGWLKVHPDLAEDYAHARELQGEADADKISDVVRQVLMGVMDPAAGRVAIDALKWTAGRRLPKKYGDRAALDVNVSVAAIPLADLKKRLEVNSQALGLPPPDFAALGLETS